MAFVGLLIAFLLALVLRAYAIRITARMLGLTDSREPVTPRLREDIDPFGAVAAAVGGAGWGKVIDVDEVPRFSGRARSAAIFAAGPIVTLVGAQIFFLIHRFAYPDSFLLQIFRPSNILRGEAQADVGAVLLMSVAVGLLAFGLLALIPIPPLDGFGILWSAMRRPGTGMQNMRLWLDHKNLGVVILLVCSFFPLGSPLILIPVDLIGTVFMRLWG
jgi:hypothetical protein